MNTTATTPAQEDEHEATPGLGSTLLRPAVGGLVGVVVAMVVGTLLAAFLSATGLTTTSPWLLGRWLAGGGLLGGWRQDVTADVGNGISWTVTAAFAPLLITACVWLTVGAFARGRTISGWAGVAAAAGGAAVGGGLLVLISGVENSTVNAAGTVTASEGLTAVWTSGSHPGVIVGAAVLAAAAWASRTVGRGWWRAGRGLVIWFVIVPGIVLSLVASAATWYLTSSVAVAASLFLLFPLLGALAVPALAGAPVSVSLTRLTPEVVHVDLWGRGLVVGCGGIVVLLVLAAVVGFVLGRRGHVGPWVPAIVVVAVAFAFIAWAQTFNVHVPAGIGAPTIAAVSVPVAALAGAGMAVVALTVRDWESRRRGSATTTAPSAS